MKAILSMAIVAALSTALAGCWVYSRPVGDPDPGCQKTTYGIAIATTSTEKCTPDATASPAPPQPPPSQ
jgi:hypothetical protein